MDEVRKQNAKELRRAWNKFIKEQKAKYGHKTIIGDAEKDLHHWTNAQLHIAYDYCVDMCMDMDEKSEVYAWWWNLRETIRQELTERGGRR